MTKELTTTTEKNATAASEPTALSPSQVVAALDEHIVGQAEAKKAVAIAYRDRFRRLQLPKDLAEEVTPSNILMKGNTGVGKTEIARRLASISKSPFVKVEASSFTEVGYVGKSVDSMISALVHNAVQLVRDDFLSESRAAIEEAAKEELFALISRQSTLPRPAMEIMWQEGKLQELIVEYEVLLPAPPIMSGDVSIPLGGILPPRKKKKRGRADEAFNAIYKRLQESALEDTDLIDEAIRRAECGIIFIDEIDKIASRGGHSYGPDVSREGVQRDILPIVEGTTVTTEYGLVKTDHILFIAAGAFHMTELSDLIPELQGRFPIKVELSPLSEEDLFKILTQPKYALPKQLTELLRVDGVELVFTEDGLREVAKQTAAANRQEDLGARRLRAILHQVVSEASFAAPEKGGKVTIDAPFVRERVCVSVPLPEVKIGFRRAGKMNFN